MNTDELVKIEMRRVVVREDVTALVTEVRRLRAKIECLRNYLKTINSVGRWTQDSLTDAIDNIAIYDATVHATLITTND